MMKSLIKAIILLVATLLLGSCSLQVQSSLDIIDSNSINSVLDPYDV